MSPDPQTSSNASSQAAFSNKKLAEIKHMLETGYCNPVWREHIFTLIDEVERLQSLLDLAASQQTKRKKSD